MNTYYIPTSSLNFNNIFSSESISPKGFYERRNFGYSRWTTIPENPLNGAILLYGEPKMFSRPISDIVDYPMLIEIQSDKKYKRLQNGVFYAAHTIYLDPWHTKIHFFSEETKNTVLSRSDSSLETKMLRLYQKRFDVEYYNSTYSIVECIQDFPIDEIEIERDIKINKIKGLLYGYYIGAYLSISHESVKQLHALYEIRDIVSAILSSPDKTATYFQQEELRKYLSVLNSAEPLCEELLQFENNDISRVEQLMNILTKHHINLPLKNVSSFVYYLHNESLEQSNTLMDIQNRIERLNSHKHSLLQTEASELVTADYEVQSLKHPNAEAVTLYKEWIEKVLVTPKYNGNISPERAELADELTLIARDNVYKENWGNSSAKNFLNQLRKHLHGEEFTQPWSNGLLSSLAAVLIRGDEWEQLLQFMQYKEMYDYRLAFSLYGILNGFANLTRDFTDFLLEQNRQYVTDIYTEFYGQLFNRKLDIKIAEEPKSTLYQEQRPLRPDFYDEVLSIWNSYSKKDKNKTQILHKVLNNCSISTTEKEFIDLLKKEKGFTKGEAINYITNALTMPQSNSNNTSTNAIKQQPLFPRGEILEDLSWVNECENMINSLKARKQFREDIMWFIDNHKEEYIDKKKGKLNGKYFGHDTSNDRVFERLKYFLEDRVNPRNEKMQWLRPIYKDIPVMKILQKIKQLYDIG